MNQLSCLRSLLYERKGENKSLSPGLKLLAGKEFPGEQKEKKTGGGSMYRAPKIRAPGKHLESEEEQTAEQQMQKERRKNVTSKEALGKKHSHI